MGRAFYKGGFEPRMNKREAALILELSYADHVALNFAGMALTLHMM
jgi:hypothetical protein